MTHGRKGGGRLRGVSQAKAAEEQGVPGRPVSVEAETSSPQLCPLHCSALLLGDSCDVTYGFHWDYYFVVVVVFATPWTTIYQSALSFTISYPTECNTPGSPVHHYLQRLLKFVSIESVILSNYLILCRLIFLLTSVFPSIRVFSNESALHIRWTKY